MKKWGRANFLRRRAPKNFQPVGTSKHGMPSFSATRSSAPAREKRGNGRKTLEDDDSCCGRKSDGDGVLLKEEVARDALAWASERLVRRT
eukprot:4193962-Pleurochrysis_carterae.AAC.1